MDRQSSTVLMKSTQALLEYLDANALKTNGVQHDTDIGEAKKSTTGPRQQWAPMQDQGGVVVGTIFFTS
jgi:hypothetical protein